MAADVLLIYANMCGKITRMTFVSLEISSILGSTTCVGQHKNSETLEELSQLGLFQKAFGS